MTPIPCLSNIRKNIFAFLPPVVTFVLLLLMNFTAFAQLELITDEPDATYAPGETAQFTLTATSGGTATYDIIYDNFAPVITSGTIAVTANTPVDIPYTHNEPGLVICKVSLNGNSTQAAAAFALESVLPLEPEPSDFDQFWIDAKAELAAIPIDAQVSDCETSTYETTCRVNLGHIDGRRVYGYISTPSTAGPYPAMLTLPPFGSGPNACTPGDNNAIRGGVLSVSISIHNVEPDESDPNAYEPDVITNPDSVYHKYAVLGAIRAIDYIYSHPDFNGTELGVMGVSQGGGLAMLVAGIDDRVNLLLSSIPALSQHAGLKYDVASGFPYYLHGAPAPEDTVLAAVGYYDAVYSASRFNGPTWAFIGYEDLICPSATGMAAYNQLKGPKIMTHSVDLGHNTPAPYWNDRYELFRRHYPSTANPPWPWTPSTTGYYINAGLEDTIDISEQASLSATVEYNDVIDPAWPAEWVMVSGPGTVTFSPNDAYQSNATFSVPGDYVLRFTAYDYAELASSQRFTSVTDQVIITVNDNNLPPDVTLSTDTLDVNGEFDVAIQFTKIVTGLTVSDFQITNGTATNLTGSGNQYVLTVNPTLEGVVTVFLPMDSAIDNNSNGNTPSNVLSVNYIILQGLFITCPENISINALPGASNILVSWNSPTATTSCATNGLMISQTGGPTNGTAFSLGITTVTYEATDDCANLETCSFTVEVNEVPAIVTINDCPVDTLVLIDEGLSGENVSWTAPTGLSNCYIGSSVTVSQIAGLANGSFFPIGIDTIQYELTDQCGVTDTCSFVVEVAESPGTVSVSCPADTLIVMDQGETMIVVNWNLPVASSTCGGGISNPNCGTVPNGFSLIGTHNDHEYFLGNSSATWPNAEAACIPYDGHLVTIDDEVENNFIDANISSMIMIGLNDEGVEGQLEWSSQEPIGYLNLQSSSGNTPEKDYGVFQPWNGKWDFVNGSVWKKYVMELDCTPASSITLTQTGGPTSGSLLAAGVYTITYEAMDGCGDIEICNFTVTVEENSLTTMIDCPANITAYETAGAGGATVSFANATGSTTCVTGGLSVQQTGGLTSGSLFPVGSNVVTFEATDACGSTSTCTFLVNVLAIPAPLNPVPFDEFMGVNTRIQYPNDRIWVVGTVRDYYPWILSEGYPAYTAGGTTSPGYPNNKYKFNPAYQSQGYKNLDVHYDEIAAHNLILNTSMLQSVPHIVDPTLLPSSPNREAILEQKPVYPGDDPTDPASYVAHADWIYHFTARYGNNVFTSNKLNQIITPKLEPTQTPLTGLGQLNFIENWNEPDKWWYNSSYPAAYFTPIEYAAMTSADYDGHMQTLSMISDPDNAGQMISTVGAKNADPNVKFVLAGLADLNLNYIDSMRMWFDENRTANAAYGLYPFDVLNFHHYSNDNINGGIGISPEQDTLKGRLEEVIAYRDQYFPGKEVWLSEFGFDTDTASSRRVPTYGIGDYDQREVQGQWILRSFLEVSAAGVDRALLYEFRDACTGANCNTFQSSGLLESSAKNYKPKKSWYYVATLKHVMEDMEFDADISPSCGGADTLCVNDCARVYRFIDPNNPAEKVFAVWSPTSCGKAPFNYSLDLEGATEANVFELKVPSTIGEKALVSGTSIDISVSEQPVFIRVGTTTPPVTVPCLTGLQVGLQTCSTIKLNWTTTPGVNTLQIWSQPGHLANSSEFNIDTATLVIDNLDASIENYMLTGLIPDTTYSFIVVSTDIDGNISEPCLLLSNTLNTTCTVPIDPSWIYNSNLPSNPPIELFDEQANFDPFCGNSGSPTTDWGIDFNNGPEMVSVDLQDYYYLNAIALYDAASIGILDIDYSTSPNGPWIDLIDYQTNSFETWVILDNLLPPNEALRYLRITGTSDNKAVVKEMYICADVAPFDDSMIPPGPVVGLTAGNATCNSVDLSWTAPFDSDISHYEVTYTPDAPSNPIIVSPTGNNISMTVLDLEEEETYTFVVTTVDTFNNVSTSESVVFTTFSEQQCDGDDCDSDCPCFICLNTAWITDLTPGSGIDPTTLVDENDMIDPFCAGTGSPSTEWGSDWSPGNGIPPMIAVLDLQECYHLTAIQLFDGNGIGVFTIEYQDLDDNWILIEDYTTAAWQQWHSIDNLDITTRFLRFTKQDNSARINEIALCGQSMGITDCGQTETDNDNDGWTNLQGDCDDDDPAINPGATEICDGIDNDCDGDIDGNATGGSTWYADGDMDGYGDFNNSTVSCLQPPGFVANFDDCDDMNSNINPGAIEICDGLDNDCNNIVDDNVVYEDYYPDVDGDGYGDINATPVAYCIAPPDSVTNNLDCDDSLPLVNPAAAEICSDGIDNNCNNQIDEDPIAPTVTCMNASVNLDGGTASITPADVFASGSDNCGTVNLVSVIPSTFTAADIGDNTVTLTVEDASNNTNTCQAIVSVSPGATEYCGSSASAPWVEYIQHVKLNTIDNMSGKEGYGDFTGISTTVDLGSSYDFTLVPKFSWTYFDEYVRVWIDYNQDFDFNDPGELVLEQISVAGTPNYPPTLVDTISGLITIPATAISGATRMRVSMKRDAYADSCEDYTTGEVEDYTVVINSSNPLEGEQPEVLFFNAQKTGRKVSLNWVTNTGYKNDYYTIEHSRDGIDFSPIAELPDEDNSNQERIYYHLDKHPYQGSNYYRLGVMQTNGLMRYSNVKRIDFDLELNSFEIFPVPAENELYVNLRPYIGLSADLQIYNSLGQPMMKELHEELSLEPLRIDLAGWQAGVYYLAVKIKDKKLMTRRFIIVRR